MSAKPALARVRINPGRASADVITALSEEFGWTTADESMVEETTEESPDESESPAELEDRRAV